MSEKKVCQWWQLHKWGKWTLFSEGSSSLGCPVIIQKRECERCGCLQLREESP